MMKLLQRFRSKLIFLSVSIFTYKHITGTFFESKICLNSRVERQLKFIFSHNVGI